MIDNVDWLRQLNDEELTEYIYSVFTAGKMYGKNLICKSDLIDYRTWLHEPHDTAG